MFEKRILQLSRHSKLHQKEEKLTFAMVQKYHLMVKGQKCDDVNVKVGKLS